MKKGTFKKIFFKGVKISVVVFIVVVVFIFVSDKIILGSSRGYIYQGSDRLHDVPNAQTALVLGARVYQSGDLSPIFEDRAKVALGLYREGKVKKILVSGDHGQENYDEVNAAKEFFLKNSVSAEDIFLDHAGFDTYDSLYRARDVFKAESLIVCTQDFHLPRAVFIGRKLGLETYGVSADMQPYVGQKYLNFREGLARTKAMLNIIFHSQPKFLGPEIPLSGESFSSWD